MGKVTRITHSVTLRRHVHLGEIPGKYMIDVLCSSRSFLRFGVGGQILTPSRGLLSTFIAIPRYQSSLAPPPYSFGSFPFSPPSPPTLGQRCLANRHRTAVVRPFQVVFLSSTRTNPFLPMCPAQDHEFPLSHPFSFAITLCSHSVPRDMSKTLVHRGMYYMNPPSSSS